MKLIDKDALVAEIKRRKEINKYRDTNDSLFEDEAILSFINTLEVKEVDLKEEIEKCLKQHSMVAVGKKDFTDIAKHFFELGINAQNCNSKCKDLGDDGTCMYAASKTGKTMRCENINCSRKIKVQKGE